MKSTPLTQENQADWASGIPGVYNLNLEW